MLTSIALLSLVGFAAAAPIIPAPINVGAATQAGPVDAAAVVAVRDGADPLSLVAPLLTPILSTLEGAVNTALPQIANTLASNDVTGDSLTPVVQLLADALTTANGALSALNLPIQLRQLPDINSIVELPEGLVGDVVNVAGGAVGTVTSVAGSTLPVRRQLGDVTGVVGGLVSTVEGTVEGVVPVDGIIGGLKKRDINNVPGLIDGIESLFEKRQLESIESLIKSILIDVANTLEPVVALLEQNVPGVTGIVSLVDNVLNTLLTTVDGIVPGVIDGVASQLPEPVQSTLKGLEMQLTLSSLGL